MKKIAVITWGDNSERAISLKSSQSVVIALEERWYDVLVYDFPVDKDLFLQEYRWINFCFVMIHGKWGEDGQISALLDLLWIPYQCANRETCALTINKYLTKLVWKDFGLPVAEDCLIDMSQGGYDNFCQRVESVATPCVIKALCEWSTKGMWFIFSQEEWEGESADLYEEICGMYDHVLVERYIAGKEFTVAVLEQKNGEAIALPVIEIIPPEGGLFDYENKYNGKTQEICPADISDELAYVIKKVALDAYAAVWCNWYARVDVLLWSEWPVLLELNTIPGFTSESLFPKASKAAGMDFGDLLEHLLSVGSRW